MTRCSSASSTVLPVSSPALPASSSALPTLSSALSASSFPENTWTSHEAAWPSPGDSWPSIEDEAVSSFSYHSLHTNTVEKEKIYNHYNDFFAAHEKCQKEMMTVELP